MKGIIVVILLVALILFSDGFKSNTAYASDYPYPPLDPAASWQPPYDDTTAIDSTAIVEEYTHHWPHLQITPPPSGLLSAGSIISAQLVNNQGRSFAGLYRNESCYLVTSVSSPGYFYLWEYYPAGTASPGHWLCYRGQCPHAGVWQIGPFAAEISDPPGLYIWKMWFLSGTSWSTRIIHFDYYGINNPPDIPALSPEQKYKSIINSFSADKYTVELAEPIQLIWTTSNAISTMITPGISAVALKGCTSITPLRTTSYILTARDSSGQSISSTVTVIVRPRPPPSISIDSSVIRNGKSAILSWNATGAVKVSVIPFGEAGIKGTEQITPNETTTYTISATYADGSIQTSRTTVIVEPDYPFWFLVLLLLAASITIVVLLFLKRRIKRESTVLHQETMGEMSICNIDSQTAKKLGVLPITTPVIDISPARLSISNKGDIVLTGDSRSLGRKDFEKFLSADSVAYISRIHFTIWWEGSHYYIEDNSSTNGTKINGSEIKNAGSRQLNNGDIISLAGKLEITFNCEEIKA